MDQGLYCTVTEGLTYCLYLSQLIEARICYSSNMSIHLSAPCRWHHPGWWRLFRRQFQENAATVLVYRSLRAVFYLPIQIYCVLMGFSFKRFDDIQSLISAMVFMSSERASLHLPCSAGRPECRPHIAEPQHQLFPQLQVHPLWRARKIVVQALIPAAPQCPMTRPLRAKTADLSRLSSTTNEWLQPVQCSTVDSKGCSESSNENVVIHGVERSWYV